MGALVGDIRYAVRVLVKNPVFAAVELVAADTAGFVGRERWVPARADFRLG